MSNFRFYNRNPDGEVKEDCVCRAISTATGIDYKEVEKLLKITAKDYECEELCLCCYHYLIEDGFGYKPRFGHGESVGQIAERFPDDVVIIRIAGHLTMSDHGTVFDIWDCTDETVDVYWVLRKN